MNIFDIIGPIMIGPSSSHTAGAVRIGRIARKILGECAVRADITLVGSFAMTYKGHGTDKALIAGILGMMPDDMRIPRSLEIANDQELNYNISTTNKPSLHPNTAIIHLVGAGGAECLVEGISVGGGNILITRLNGMEAAFGGNVDTLIIAHSDVPGAVAAVSGYLANLGVNIGSMRLVRPRKNELSIMTLELDSDIDESVVQELQEHKDIVSVVYIHPKHDSPQKNLH